MSSARARGEPPRHQARAPRGRTLPAALVLTIACGGAGGYAVGTAGGADIAGARTAGAWEGRAEADRRALVAGYRAGYRSGLADGKGRTFPHAYLHAYREQFKHADLPVPVEIDLPPRDQRSAPR